MKTLDDLVIGRNGLWFTLDEVIKSFQCGESLFVHGSSPVEFGFRLSGTVISKEQFQQRVKELGFVGRYRWGVEYKTDGKRPELADDVVVDIRINNDFHENGWRSLRGHATYSVDAILWDEEVTAFKITDQRYKPADTSYLDKTDSSLDNELSSLDNGSDWYCYETQKALRLPPVGEKVEAFMHWTGGWSVGWVLVVGHDADGVIWRNGSDAKSYIHSPRREIRPLDHDRKAKAERKRTLDAIYNKWDERGDITEVAEWIYESGFRLPD